MSAIDNEHSAVGAYVLGALGPAERTRFEAHLATCADCRREVAELSELRPFLDEVPPEAFLDGPPADDLLLQRTLRNVRAIEERPSSRAYPDRSTGRSTKRFAMVAAAAILAVVALGLGLLVGRQTAPDNIAAPPTATTTPPPPGARTLTATDPVTQASMQVSVTPAAGWVRLHASVQGVAENERCQLIVVPKQPGPPVVAGSWLVSAKGEREGTGVDGSALVAPEDVASVDVVTVDGRTLVSAKV